MSASQRRKGHDFERWVVKRFNNSFDGFEARRGLQYQRDGGEVPDVRAGPMWIECKRGKATSLKPALRQAQASCAPGHYPMVVAKDDGQPPVVVMDLEDFIELCHEMADIVRTQ